MSQVDDIVGEVIEEKTCIEVNNKNCQDSSITKSAVQNVAEKRTCVEVLIKMVKPIKI